MKGKSLMALMGALLLLSQLPAQETDSPSDNGRESWAEEMFKGPLIDAAGEEIAVSKLKGKMVGIYFSASWCPPCRAFTPQLVKFYNQAAQKNNLEIVFVSSDKDASSMAKYMKDDKMPWQALPFDAPAGKALKKELKVSGIPHLAVFDSDGRLLSGNARWDVAVLGEKAIEKWRSPDYKPLTYQDYQKKSAAQKKGKDKKKRVTPFTRGKKK